MRDADAGVRISPAADPAALRRARLGLVLRTLRDQGPLSRARIAAELGLTRSAASGLVDELERHDLVLRGAPERGGVGRPGTTVALHGGAVCGIGAEINVDHVAVLALDLAGSVVAETRHGLVTQRLGADGVLDDLTGLLARVLADVDAAGHAVSGITVGVAGLVDAERELVTLAPNLGWRDIPLAARIRDLLGPAAPPVRVDNEANLAAVAEIDPSDPDRETMLVLYGEVGVGGGVVTDSRLLRGRYGWAGELGHLAVEPQGRPCGCGRTGCWETVIGLRALLEAGTDPDDPVRDPELTLEERLERLAQRARQGDTRTLSALHRVGSWIGVGASGLVNALNPGTLVLSGYFAVLGQWLRPAVEEQLALGVVAPAGGGTRVALSSHGPTAAVRGGALVSLEPVLHDPLAVPLRRSALTGGAL